MAFKFADRVVETTQTTGTGSLDLDGAVDGYQSFTDELTDGDEVTFVIEDNPAAPTAWEISKGVFNTGTPNTLTRATVLKSSNSGNKISLQSGTTYTVTAILSREQMGNWLRKNSNVRSITGDDSMVAADDGKLIKADGSGNSPEGLTYSLLAAATAGDGFVVSVKNTGSSGAVTIDGNSTETIDGKTTLVLANQNDSVTLRCDGTGWQVVARTVAPGIVSVTGDYTVTGEDAGRLILADGSGNSPAGLTITLGSAATLGTTFNIDIRNVGASGTVTVSASDNVNGASSLDLEPEASTRVRCTGSTYWTVGGVPTLPFTESYESGEQAITAGGTLTLAHGLSATPKLYLPYLKCVSAEMGYSVGNEIPAFTGPNGTSSTAIAQGVSIVPDATNLVVRYGAHSNVFTIIEKDDGNISNLTLSSWKLIVRAWA